MTERVHGTPEIGAWFERDVSWLRADLGAALDFGLDANVEQAIRVLQTRGTILAMNDGAGANELELLFGHAAGAFTDLSAETATSILADLQAELAKVLPGATLTLGTGFLVKV